MELNALLGQPVALPSLPRTVALLMNELAQREPSLRRLNLLFGFFHSAKNRWYNMH